ncbi:MAG TPA: alkaline phosphatase PhoX [Acidimicrobiales bacterium]|nr:alkaline phosphatase PhoX [Acidimicrobiales bacterium]
MNRRSFLLGSVAALAAARLPVASASTSESTSVYGELLPPDANGVRLPAGFRSRVVARTGDVVGANVWHPAPDGGACFPTGDGGWVYASNSEVPVVGGAGAVRFSSAGDIVDSYRILTGTTLNCAGGATPWGTWLSCEEHPLGMVWECDPQRPGQGVPRPALGHFAHEAVAIDPVRGHAYLTEDTGTGLFRRFTPSTIGSLAAGTLEAVRIAADGTVTWVPDGAADATTFDGGEGVWFHEDRVYFTSKGDNTVRVLDVVAQRVSVLYDADGPLNGVDNVTVSGGGDVLVAEDGGDMQICVLADGVVTPIVQVVGHDGSEITGPAFSPDGTRLYFSSQRGPAAPQDAIPEVGRFLRPGVTFEVTGPFRP